MKASVKQSRRNVLKLGSLVGAILPLTALAARNEARRKAMGYQDTPLYDRKCSNCVQFSPGKTPADLGGCNVYFGDTEISPSGYCSAWAKQT